MSRKIDPPTRDPVQALRLVSMQLDTIESQFHTALAAVRAQVAAALPPLTGEQYRRRGAAEYRKLMRKAFHSDS